MRAQERQLALVRRRFDDLDQRAVQSFAREGETWLVGFGDESTRLKDADGLRYLAYLVARPMVPAVLLDDGPFRARRLPARRGSRHW